MGQMKNIIILYRHPEMMQNTTDDIIWIDEKLLPFTKRILELISEMQE